MNRQTGAWIILVVFFLFACEGEKKKDRFGHLDYRTKIRLRQYLGEGKRLYEIHCANCHQADGAGLARLYPPLKNSDYLLANRQEVICGMRHGQKGEIIVNGIMYNMEMPPIPSITDLEIAEIATYIYTEFADSVHIVTLNDVADIMKNCDTSAK
ncbi:MAG: cytochrome c [Cyclobacteriaceae bacterium]|nr:cytochrome c [Cyclobacteriaceae bacterium]